MSDAVFAPYGLPLPQIGGRSGRRVDIPIPPHTRQYIESKEKGMNRYTIPPHPENETESKKIKGIDE